MRLHFKNSPVMETAVSYFVKKKCNNDLTVIIYYSGHYR